VSGVDRFILASLTPFAGWTAADLDGLLAPAHARRFDNAALPQRLTRTFA